MSPIFGSSLISVLKRNMEVTDLDLSNVHIQESAPSTAANAGELVNGEVVKEKRVIFGVEERPPIVLSILLGFQVKYTSERGIENGVICVCMLFLVCLCSISDVY